MEEYTCPSSASSYVSRDSKSPPQPTELTCIEPASQLTPENVKKRMQVKLGRTRSPETLIGTASNINVDEDLESNEWKTVAGNHYENGSDNHWDKNKGQMQKCETKNDGRQSMSSRVSHYDYSEIYSSSLKLT